MKNSQGSKNDPRTRAPPPEYWQTRPSPTRVVCRAYTAPPSLGGHLICTIQPGTFLGPVEDKEATDEFVTICVQGWWINVWGSKWGQNGTWFAHRVPDVEILLWEHDGWRHSAGPAELAAEWPAEWAAELPAEWPVVERQT